MVGILEKIIQDKSLLRESKCITGCCGKKESFEKTKNGLQKIHPNLNSQELEQITTNFLASIEKITK